MPWKNEPELNRPESSEETESNERMIPNISRDESAKPQARNDQVMLSNSSINDTLKELIKELRRRRRWGFVLKLIGWLVIVGLLSSLLIGGGGYGAIKGPHTAMVRLEGVIADGNDASANNVLTGLLNAYESTAVKGIILSINSPGGSPVQSDLLYREIQKLKSQYDKPLVAVINDIGASGGYYAAVAADTIYANPASIVGSIGVLVDGFGFVGLMEKAGVERRLLIAGENKAGLDPFSPVEPQEREHVQSVIDGVHEQFIEVVRSSRGAKLKENDEMFSGQFWNGQQAYEMGLTDGFKTPWAVASEDFNAQNIVDYTQQPDILQQLSRDIGVSIGEYLKLNLTGSVPNLR